MAAGSRPAVEVHGAKELRRALKRMDDRAQDMKDVHAKAGLLIADRAHKYVPQESGALAGTIRHDRRQTGASVLAGRSRVPYAGVIHFGWPGHNIEAQPFLYAALEDGQNEVIDIYKDGVQELCDKLDRETP